MLLSSGGADRDRTDDLLNAIQALSQLSYGPKGLKIILYFTMEQGCYDRPVASSALPTELQPQGTKNLLYFTMEQGCYDRPVASTALPTELQPHEMDQKQI